MSDSRTPKHRASANSLAFARKEEKTIKRMRKKERNLKDFSIGLIPIAFSIHPTFNLSQYFLNS